MVSKKKSRKKPRPDILQTEKKWSTRYKRWIYFFTRHTPNGEKLPASQMYRSRSGRNDAINRILERENAIVKRD